MVAYISLKNNADSGMNGHAHCHLVEELCLPYRKLLETLKYFHSFYSKGLVI